MHIQTVENMIPYVFKECRITLDIFFLVRKIFRKAFSVRFMACHDVVAFAVYAHVVAVVVQTYPRQVEKPEIFEKAVQMLSFVQSSYVVESRVECFSAALERLQATADNAVAFQNAYSHAFFRQHERALKTSQSAADYHYVVFCHLRSFSYYFLK